MRIKLGWGSAAVLAIWAAGCGSDDSSGTTSSDTGTDSGTIIDTGSVTENGSDTSTDSGTITDTGSVTENGSDTNTGSDTDTESSTEPATSLPITPGVGIGDFVVGRTYAEIRATFGGQASEALTYNRMSSLTFSSQHVDTFFLSTETFTLSDDAILIAVGANQGGAFTGTITPGMTKAAIDAVDDDTKESGAKYTFYPKGTSVQYEADVATVVGVFAPYTLAYEPPAMEPAKTSR